MRVKVRGKVMGVREIERKSGAKGYVVELYQPGESRLARVVCEEAGWGEGEEVELECRVVSGKERGYACFALSSSA